MKVVAVDEKNSEIETKKNTTKSIKKALPTINVMDENMVKNIHSLLNQGNKPKEKIKKLDEIIKTAIQNDLPKTLALSYYQIGIAYKELGQWQVALQFLELADRKKNAIIPSEIYLEMGLILSKTGKYKASNEKLFFYKKKIESESVKSDSEMEHNVALDEVSAKKASSTNSIKTTSANSLAYCSVTSDGFVYNPKLKVEYAIAENYFASEQFKLAISSYEKLAIEEKKSNNEIGLLECYSRLAACYISIGQTKKGIAYYTASVQKVNKSSISNKQKISETKEFVSSALRKQGKYKEDLDIRNSTLNFSKDEGLEHLRLAQSYFKTRQNEKAENSIDKYIAKPSYNIIDRREVIVLKDISKFINKKGDTEKAYRYLSLYTSLQDTIKNRIANLDLNNNDVEGFQSILQLEVLRKDKEISMNAINHLMEEDKLKEDALSNHRITIGLLLFLLVIGTIGGIYILRVSKQRRIANQQLALRSLRSQMNPHFIFNALNSVNSFISENDERSANKFLSEFSRLMRSVMENSEHDFISLTKELEIVRIYMQLEHFRFKDKFNYTIEVDSNIDEDAFQLPPMLIQPYIENAIWHGLRYKEEIGNLSLSFKLNADKLTITLIDDGIGRTKSAEIKTANQLKNKSTALKNINERITIFNELHRIKIEVSITDVEADGSGTRVELSIPQNSKQHA
jgi:tetratricopeptide (TPR) repeat protein